MSKAKELIGLAEGTLAPVEESQGPSLAEKAKFIFENSSYTSDYDLDEPYVKTMAKKLEAETGVYLGYGRKNLENSSLGLVIKYPHRFTYDQLKAEYERFVGKQGFSGNELWEKDFFKIIWDWYYTSITGKNQIKTGDHGLSMIVALLYYVVTGKQMKDMKIPNEIMDANGWSYSSIFKNHKMTGFKGAEKLNLTRFKNGKITIKGLSAQQWKDFERIIVGMQPERFRR